jgi:hypothetical protein
MRTLTARRSFRIGFLVLPVSLLTILPGVVLAATVTVTGTGDSIAVDGSVTLREAITSMNNGANVNADVVAVGAYGTSNTINFSIGSGVQTIAPAGSQLPPITVPVVINGTTQPGFAGTPLIVLDGVSAGAFSRGLTINGGNSTVRGLVIHRFFYGIELSGGDQNTIAGNYFGLDATGTLARANTDTGILVESGSDNNVIGGTTVADRNVISGSPGNGLQVQTVSGILIQGNYIGTNAAGTAAIGNGTGINLNIPNATIGGTSGVTPGGPCTGACNLVSGNVIGIGLGSGASGVQILGNLVGTNAAGTGALGNTGGGITVPSSMNTIGGTNPSAGNVIAFNGSSGVSIGDGTANAILSNSIFSNGGIGLGIDINTPGVNPNDAGDPDKGVNNLQNFPVITSAPIAAGMVTISGTLNSIASTNFRLEFFSNVACNGTPPNNFGEGQTFLGFLVVATDASGNATFGGPLSTFSIPPGQTVITATATDPGNNTSEFSACFASAGGVTPTPTPTSTATPTVTLTPAVATPTPTLTATPGAPTATASPTLTPAAVAAVVPTLSPSILVLLGVALAATALLLIRRSG